MDLLKALSEMSGAPGREEHVRAFILSQVKEHIDEHTIDAMGNLICRKKSAAPGAKRVMLACHMDEIAFYVRTIDDRGFLRLQPLGGFDVRNLFARRVRVQGRDGSTYLGNMNPGGKPVHLASAEERKKIPMISQFFVDLGLPAETVKEVVRPGDPVTLVQEFAEIGDLVSGKSMDNRVACWLGVRVLQQLTSSKYDLHVAFTVQEEIGVRGAQTSAFAVEPDISIGLDVTLAVDLPGAPPEDSITRLGEGVAIKIMDSGSVSDHALVDEFVELAESKDITYQFEILPFGGTDTAALQRARAGSKAITLSVPTRYVHTITETIHKLDLHAALDLLKAYLSA
ncbi:MAG: M42 family peptidase [Myxococcota bacterium]